MIARHWTGFAPADKADDYERYLLEHTFPELEAIDGFRGGSILRAETGEGVAFRVITEWTSLDHVRAFAGDDVERAVVPDAAAEMLVRFDRKVTHYEVRYRAGD